jgi:hypothetical protein
MSFSNFRRSGNFKLKIGYDHIEGCTVSPAGGGGSSIKGRFQIGVDKRSAELQVTKGASQGTFNQGTKVDNQKIFSLILTQPCE